MDRVPAELASVVVLDKDGAEHRLGEAWSKSPALLVFLRHFG